MRKVTDSINEYKESGAIRIRGGDKGGCLVYNGMNIDYPEKSFTRAEFIEYIGDEIIRDHEEGTAELTGECCGHIKIEVWEDEWHLELETAHADVIEMSHLNINILRKLAKFLNYVVDGLSNKETK